MVSDTAAPIPAPRGVPLAAAAPGANARPRLHIDLDALVANYRTLEAAAPGAAVGAAVKADGYGLGAALVVRALSAAGCRAFFVANAQEGAQLRRARAAPAEARIHVLGGIFPGDEPFFAEHALTPVLNTRDQVRLWAEARAAWRAAGPASLHVDTGMNRLGLSLAEVEELLTMPDLLASAGVDVLMSHLACASEPEHGLNGLQRERFLAIAARLGPHAPQARLSLANSAGAFLSAHGGVDYALDLVRPGIALYGGSPFDPAVSHPPTPLRPVAHLFAPILQVRDVAAGDSIGYGATFTAPAPMRVATVAIGYADGFLRAAAAGGYGVLAGERTPIVGRVSMDLISVDVSAAGAAARPGAWVEFLGAHADLEDQAVAAETISYEFLTRLGPRCERSYSGGAVQ